MYFGGKGGGAISAGAVFGHFSSKNVEKWPKTALSLYRTQSDRGFGLIVFQTQSERLSAGHRPKEAAVGRSFLSCAVRRGASGALRRGALPQLAKIRA